MPRCIRISNLQAIDWFITNNLIQKPKCINCKEYMRILKCNDSYKWQCYKCIRVNGIFNNSIVKNTKIEPLKIIELLYLWEKDTEMISQGNL